MEYYSGGERTDAATGISPGNILLREGSHKRVHLCEMRRIGKTVETESKGRDFPGLWRPGGK